MNGVEQKRFEELYRKHRIMLENHGMQPATVDSYSRAVRRVSETFDCCPDSVTMSQMKEYFNALTKSHSWSTIKCDLSGLKFFWEYVLEKDWNWVSIVRPPQIKSLPDVLTIDEVESLLNTVRKVRYRVFLFTNYSMGLRLGETLNLRVPDIDGKMMRVHIRNGKGRKDRFVTLPQATLEALRNFQKNAPEPKSDFPESERNPRKHQKSRVAYG